MLKCRWFVLFVSILVCGCGQSWEKNPSREYPVWVSDQFTEEQQTQLTKGVRTWESALNGYLSFSFTTAETSSIRFIPSTIEELQRTQGIAQKLGSDSNKQRIGFCNYHGSGSRIQIAVDIDALDFKWVTLHEMGHALGLRHSGPKTVMCDVDTCASPEITVTDLEQFYSVWNQ